MSGAEKVKLLIIGAGPTGLGAGLRIKDLNKENEFRILEGSNTVGGLARSFVDENGFTWDIGAHVQFSHYQYFDETMSKCLPGGKDSWFTHTRATWVWMRENFIPYPFQNNIRYLPKDDMWKCLKGLIDVYQEGGNSKPKNFQEWIDKTMGKGIREVFMDPYNFKVWAYPTSTMGYTWIGERVAVSDLARVTKNVLFNIDDLSWGPNSTFGFPKVGGTHAVWKGVANMVGMKNIELETKVIEIDPVAKIVKTNTQKEYQYEKLLTTIPIDVLVTLIKGMDQKLVEKAKQLKKSRTWVVGIGIKGKVKPQLKDKSWIYFPEMNCPFYRATIFSNFSPHNVPDPNIHWSVMTETSDSEYKPVNPNTIVQEVIDGLKNVHFLIDGEDEVVSKFVFSTEHGYPTPSIERDELLEAIVPELEKMDIYSRGRFGLWKYEIANQDHSFMQGVEWANRVVLKVPEVTINFPGTANAYLFKKFTDNDGSVFVNYEQQ